MSWCHMFVKLSHGCHAVTWMSSCCPLACKQVLSTRQVAEMMVHAYPFVNVHEALLESLATHRQELTKDDIVAAAMTNRMAADYAQLLQYCEVVGASAYSGHLPIWTCCPGAKST